MFPDPEAQTVAFLRAVFPGWRMLRQEALVFADYLEERGDKRADIVRSMAAAIPGRVENAWADTPCGPAITVLWSAHERRKVRLAIRAPSDCLQEIVGGSQSPCRELCLGANYADRGCRRRAEARMVLYALHRYRPSTFSGQRWFYESYPLVYLQAPRGYGIEALAIDIYEVFAACVLAGLFNVELGEEEDIIVSAGRRRS
jgi:hypothetical protein